MDGLNEGGHRRRGVRLLFDHFEEIVAALAMSVVVLAVAWGVFTRYVLASSAPWTGEIAAIGFSWLIFMGAAAGFKRGMHISIDALVNLLPAPARRMFMGLIDLLVVVFCAYVCWLAIRYAITVHGSPTSVLRLPSSIPYAAPAVGFGFMALRIGTSGIARLRGRETGPQ